MSQQQSRRGTGTAGGMALALLAASAVCVAVAPFLMPDSYSVVEHSVSESAGQGVEGAWLARFGFLFLGFAVLLIANRAEQWGVWGRLAHRVYGVAMIATATFAHRPWEDIPFDVFEDFLHSAAATVVGFAFTVGVLLVSLNRPTSQRAARSLDGVAILAAIVVSAAVMFELIDAAGLVQRVMFGIGYLWYGIEAIRTF
jgi:hypothetical protein